MARRAFDDPVTAAAAPGGTPHAPTAPDDDQDDHALLLRARAGEADALAALYRRHAAAVHRFAWLVSGHASDASDVLHDTFVALLEQPAGYDPARGRFAAWLCGIARHLALRRRARAARDVALDDDADLHAAVVAGPVALPPLPGDALSRRQALAALYDAVRALPAPWREVVVLVDLQEFGYAEAAAITGTPVGTVRSRLSRARARLAELLAAPDAMPGKDP